ADAVPGTFVRCLEPAYKAGKSYNLRGHLVDLPTFRRALCEVAPEAERLITHGDRQIAIAYDLDDSALQRDLGPMPRTPLEDGIRLTYQAFKQLNEKGHVSAADMD